MAYRNRKTQRPTSSPQQKTPVPQKRARPTAPVQQQVTRPVVQQAPMQQQTPVSQPINVAPVSQSLPRPMNPAMQQAPIPVMQPPPAVQPRPVPAVQPPPMPATTNAFAQYPIPSVNGAFRENGMQNPEMAGTTTRSPQQQATVQKMGILNTPQPTMQAPSAVSPIGSIPRPASPTMETSPVQQQIAPAQQAVPRPLPQETPYQAPLSPVTPATPTDEPGWDQPVPEVAPVGQVEPRQVDPVPQVGTPTPVTPTPQIGATDPVAPVQEVAPVGQAAPVPQAATPAVSSPIADPVPEIGATDPIDPTPKVTSTPSVAQPTPSPISSTTASTNGGSIGITETPLYTPQPMPAPIISDIQQSVGNGTTNLLPPPPKGDITGGGVTSSFQNPNIGTGTTTTYTPSLPPRDTTGGGTSLFQNPNIGTGGGTSPTPALPTPIIPTTSRPRTTAPPTGGGLTPPVAPPPITTGDVRGGFTGPGTGGGGGGPTGSRSGSMLYNEQGEDYSQSAGTGSAQNPYSSIYGGMQDPLAFLRGQGINIGEDYSRYFQGYDPAMEQGAYQQYGLGQQAQMMGARAGLMGMTQQQGAGGFAGAGFGGGAARGIRGQFGLQQQQAGLGLRGDIYGMRREQEEDWWTTLGRVEEARGEQFGMFGIGTGTEHSGEIADTINDPNVDPNIRGGGGAGLTFDYQGDTIPENPTVGQTWNIPAIGNVAETTVYFTGEPPPNDWVDAQTWKSEYGGGG